MIHALLILGLVFPAISWLSFITAVIQSRRTGKGISGVYIPFIGPVLIDVWLHGVGAPAWYVVLPWVADIGTLFFLLMIPAMIVEAWTHSRFTRTFLFVGEQGDQDVKISLHKGGHYVLTKQWQRSPSDYGIIRAAELGRYKQNGNEFTLTSDQGQTRTLRRQAGTILVVDPDSSEDYKIDGWTLRDQSASSSA